MRRRPSPDYSWVGSCINSFEACSAFTHVTTCRLTKSPYATLYTGGSGGFVASTAAPIATGWSDPVPGRVFHPAVDQCLFTAHCNRLITSTITFFLRQPCFSFRRILETSPGNSSVRVSWHWFGSQPASERAGSSPLCLGQRKCWLARRTSLWGWPTRRIRSPKRVPADSWEISPKAGARLVLC